MGVVGTIGEDPRGGAGRPQWFSTLLTSIESSVSRCIEHFAVDGAAPASTIGATTEPADAVFVLPLSARSAEELDNLVWWWTNVLEDERVSLPRSCATAALRRHHPHRVAIVASQRERFLEGLQAVASDRLVLWCEPGASAELVRLAVLHVRGKWVDWRAVYGRERHRLFTES
jgi:hypothetical protein